MRVLTVGCLCFTGSPCPPAHPARVCAPPAANPERPMKTVTLPSGETVPALGQGTWQMAGDRGRRAEEIATLQLGLDLGLPLIDTAEMYGDGAAGEQIAE